MTIPVTGRSQMKSTSCLLHYNTGNLNITSNMYIKDDVMSQFFIHEIKVHTHATKHEVNLILYVVLHEKFKV